MPEETRPIKNCVACKLPILPEQRPAILLENGKEVHCECWNKYTEQVRDKPN